MIKRTAVLLTIVLCTAAAPAVAAPDLDGLSGPRALAEVDLAGTWDFAPRGETPTTIEVPGGGWYKQGFDVPAATYSRTVTVPEVAPGQVTQLVLGAVNHEATVFVDDRRVGTQTTSYTPQVHDLSAHVRPGGTYRLRVEVKGRQGLVSGPGEGTPTLPGYAGPSYLVPTGVEWSEGTAQGIFRSARLRVLPAVHIGDAHVRPSVAERRLRYDVWLRNASAAPRRVRLGGALRPATGRRWSYPSLPSRTVTVPAGGQRKVTVGVSWQLPRASWWWPNVPYRPGYRAQLHDLVLTLGRPCAGARRCRPAHRARYRFGFREIRQRPTWYELNGVRVNFRGDSLGAGSYDRIVHGAGKGDAFDTLPGFLPPSEGNGGWPKAVDNYLRLNMSTVRIHQIPATPYMLDVADAKGLMIIGETAIRGSQQRQDFAAAEDTFVEHARQLVLRDRNHASVLRWSQANEPDADQRDSVEFQRELYDAIIALDDTRPISVDVTSNTYEEIDEPNFSVYQHYVNETPPFLVGGYTEDVHPRDDRPFGKGEFLWPLSATPQVFTWFGTATHGMRERDASDIRPYAMASTWPAVVPGVRSTDYLTEENTKVLYGEDNLPDPWSNPIIRRVRQGFHPVLVADRAYWEQHQLSDPLGNWPTPTMPSVLSAGEPSERELAVFNDTFAGRRVDVTWQAREGSPTGPVADSGRFTLDVPLGEHRTQAIMVRPRRPGRLHLVLAASKPGQGELFSETDQVFEVVG